MSTHIEAIGAAPSPSENPAGFIRWIRKARDALQADLEMAELRTAAIRRLYGLLARAVSSLDQDDVPGFIHHVEQVNGALAEMQAACVPPKPRKAGEPDLNVVQFPLGQKPN